MPMPERLTVEIDREADGRWIAEIPSLPAVLAYGATREEMSRRGQQSIRVKQQWRICFRSHDGAACDVEIVDYHD